MQEKLFKIAQASSYILRLRNATKASGFSKRAGLWDSFAQGFNQGYSTGKVQWPSAPKPTKPVTTPSVRKPVTPTASMVGGSQMSNGDVIDNNPPLPIAPQGVDPVVDPRLGEGLGTAIAPPRANRGSILQQAVNSTSRTPKYKSTLSWNNDTGYDLGSASSEDAYNAAKKEWQNLNKFWKGLDLNQQKSNQAGFDKRKKQLEDFAKTYQAYRRSFKPSDGQPAMYAPNSPEGMGQAMGIQAQQRLQDINGMRMRQNLQNMQQNQQAFMAQQRAKMQATPATAMPRRRMAGGMPPATNNNLIMNDYV